VLDGDWERKNKDERAINEKNRQVCPQQKLLAIFAGDQIRRDQRIKSSSVLWALGGVDKIWIGPDQNGPDQGSDQG